MNHSNRSQVHEYLTRARKQTQNSRRTLVKAGQLASADVFYKLLRIALLELQAGLMGLRYFLVPTDFCKGR